MSIDDPRPAIVVLEGAKLVLCRCPGRDRSVRADIAILASHGVHLLLSLVEPAELPDRTGLADGLAQARIAWQFMPVPDFEVPPPRAWPPVSREIHAHLGRGEAVAIHCWGGKGRTGMIAARLIVERSGLSAEEAIAIVRSARSGAVETAGQDAWVAHGS